MADPIPCVIESPYAGDVERNMAYLEKCIRWCACHGYAPYASHKMMTVALDDSNPEERTLGINCGLAFRKIVAVRLFFIDLGWSNGMLHARELYDSWGLKWEERSIANWITSGGRRFHV